MRKSIGRLLSIGLLLMTLAIGLSGQQPAGESSTSTPLAECGTVVIIGAVRSPSRFELRRSVRLNELIESAGGVADNAGKVVGIIHTGPAANCPHSNGSQSPGPVQGVDSGPIALELFVLAKVLQGERESNPDVYAGDIVTVIEREPVYITGGVVRPQGIYLTQQLTLSQAIAMVGGATRDRMPDK